jgi:hypothetical protein
MEQLSRSTYYLDRNQQTEGNFSRTNEWQEVQLPRIQIISCCVYDAQEKVWAERSHL